MDPYNRPQRAWVIPLKDKHTMEKKDSMAKKASMADNVRFAAQDIRQNKLVQDFRQLLLDGLHSLPATSTTAPPSTSTVEPDTSTPSTAIPEEFDWIPATSTFELDTSTPCTPIPKELEWIPATSTPKERKEFTKWALAAALKAKEEGDDDEFYRLLDLANSVTSSTIATCPPPQAYKRYLLWSHSTSEKAAPVEERKRLFKWKRSAERSAAPDVSLLKFVHRALRSAAPDEPKRWSLEEEILKPFETAMQIVEIEIRQQYLPEFSYTDLRLEHVIYSCKGEPGLYQCQNALWIWPELMRYSASGEIDDGPEIIAENIKKRFPKTDMIDGRPSTDELGFVTIKLSGKWIAKSIHTMLKHGIDTWAPKLTVKKVIVDCPSLGVDMHVDWFRLLPIVYTLMSILEYSGVDVTLAQRMNLPKSSQGVDILNRWFPCEKREGYVVIKREVPFILPKTDFQNAYKDIFALGYGICEQKADWMVWVTPIRQQVYTETCLAVAKLEGWIPNDRHKPPRLSYAGYRSCTTEVTENLLDIAKIRHEAVLEGGAAKLLGYRAEEVLDCVFRYTSLVNHRSAACVFDDKMFDEKENTFVYLLNTSARIRRITNDCRKDIVELKKASHLILEKDEGWENGEERVLGFYLLEFTEVLEESCMSVLPHILCEYLYDLAKKFNSYHSSVYEDGSAVETSTLLLYEATDVVMGKCFHLLGISPGVVKEKFSHRSGITLPSSFFESPVTIFRRALLLSTVERPMDVNARDATRNFRFELFSFRTTPSTPLWIDNKGWVFGQISASDKFGLRGSQFSERDFAHVSLFNEDWRNPIQINNSGLVYIGNPSSGHPVSFSCFIEICLELYVTNKNEGYQVCDHKKDLDLAEFWDKKSEGVCGCLSVVDKNGCTRLYYMLLRDAIDTSLKIKFNTETDSGACEVRGYIIAYYGDDFLNKSRSETKISKDCCMALLFRSDAPYVLNDGDSIPLVKSVLAVPTKGSLIVKAYMEDVRSNKVIMNKCFKFKPLLDGFTRDTIIGRECSLDLTASWNYLARYL